MHDFWLTQAQPFDCSNKKKLQQVLKILCNLFKLFHNEINVKI